MFLLWTLLCCILLQVSAEKPLSYPIKWENVPSISLNSRNLESPYIGECVCDVTWGSCDPNCCCDNDCSDIEKKIFNFCLEEKVSNPPIDYCDEYHNGEKNIQKTERYIDEKKWGYKATCIIRSNNAKDIIPFFPLPINISKPILKNSNDWFKENKINGYIINGGLLLIKRIEVSTSNFEFRNIGLLTIPSTNQDGYCTLRGRRIKFMNPIDTTSCILKGNQICTLFPTISYANLFLTYPGSSTSETFTPIQLNIFNDTSGEKLITIDSNSSIPLQYQSIISNNICQNAVIRVRTLLVYNSNEFGLLLSNSVINLYIRDVNIENFNSLNFQTEFSKINIETPINYFSGTPGYSSGSRVRAGTLVENNGKKAIAERIAGFSIPSGDRSCYENNYRKVSFLHDIKSSGCKISISEEELREICGGTGTGGLLRNILSINVENSSIFDGETNLINYVARTNDAQTNDTSSWIKIEGLDFSDINPNSYNSLERECSNIYVGLNFKFVLSRVGAENNPQDIIVAAFTDPIIGKWKIHNKSDFSVNAVSTQRFRFLVSFLWLDSNSKATVHRRVIAPPILPRLDDTIFYPFRTPR